MYLTHCNDGKEKWQSHEIEFNEDNFADYKRMIFGLDPTSITGYGSTKEEAFKDFKEKFCFVMEKLKEFESTLNSIDAIDNVREKYE